jgi:hypothetical protein
MGMRGPKTEKVYRLTWRYSEEYNSTIEELMNMFGMTKSEAVEYVFDFYKHHVAAREVKSRSR